jgi:ABC-2 type transport system permease protein
MWPLRLLTSKLRPLDAASVTRVGIVAVVFALFVFGDYALFARLFRAISQVEQSTPFFAIGLLRNLTAMVFLVATVVLFSSGMTAAIGAFFTDLDLDLYHAAPRSKTRIVISRWLKTLLQSATLVYIFVVPLFAAYAVQYGKPWTFHAPMLINLALLLSIPVSVASLVIVLLVRFFPVRRVHQIVATLAILVLTLAVVAFRVSRPERFFAEINTDDVARALRQIELPSMDAYPSTALADLMTNDDSPFFAKTIAIPAVLLFALFVAVARRAYFPAFVRARESLAPVALGSAAATRLLDRLFGRASPPVRALIAKEIRILVRDVAQWSQLFLMAALLFIYLYNVRMLPLGGDARATLVAYANLGMAGFVIAAICLRFAYPSVSAEGKAFWLVQTSPVSYREFLRVKVLVYAAPLTLFALVLTALANVILDANLVVWSFTLFGASLLAITLVSLGVGMGAYAPDFNIENPLQVGLSLGGFAYMAVSLMYVGAMMLLMSRPVMHYFFWKMFGADRDALSSALPLVIALTLSAALAVIPLRIAERRLARIAQK